VSDRVNPKALSLEELLTNLHTQLYVMRSQVAAWQSDSAASCDRGEEGETTGRALSLMETSCDLDWEIGQTMLAVLKGIRKTDEQTDSSSSAQKGTTLPTLNKLLPKTPPLRHPSSIMTAPSSSLAAN
jgi:hypothetical protein